MISRSTAVGAAGGRGGLGIAGPSRGQVSRIEGPRKKRKALALKDH